MAANRPLPSHPLPSHPLPSRLRRRFASRVGLSPKLFSRIRRFFHVFQPRVGEEAAEVLDAGGFACLPAREVQRISCVSATRCTFYLVLGRKSGIPSRAGYQVMLT